ncbi:hypothetical protein SCYAM73S_02747 [Streptomyces cyaneofuscatus]
MTGYHGDPDRTAEAMSCRLLPHRGHRRPRRGRLHHLRGPRRRRVQGLRLQDLAVRSPQAPCSNTRRSPRPPSCPRPTRSASPSRRRTSRSRKAGSRGRTRRRSSSSTPGGPRPVQTHPQAGVRGAAQDRLGQDPPHRTPRTHRSGHRRRVRRGRPEVSLLSYAHGTGDNWYRRTRIRLPGRGPVRSGARAHEFVGGAVHRLRGPGQVDHEERETDTCVRAGRGHRGVAPRGRRTLRPPRRPSALSQRVCDRAQRRRVGAGVDLGDDCCTP